MKKAIHIVIDDKFIDSAIDIFSRMLFFEHRYLWLRQYDKFKWIKQINKIEIIEDTKELIEILNIDADIIFIHSLYFHPRHLLHINANIKTVWIFWGYDAYSNKGFFNEHKLLRVHFYKSYTQKYIKEYRKKRLIENFKSFIHNIFFNHYYWLFVKRVDYIANELSFEYELLKKNNNLSAKYIYFQYLFQETQYVITGDNILLGNSADISNNHLDVIQLLKNIDLRNRKIFLPLSYPSYSDKAIYIKRIQESLELVQNISSEIMEDYMPLEKYHEKISSCAYAIFGHIRQQALGNIIQLLFNGCKIFLYKESIVYRALVEKGFILFTIDNDLNHDLLNTPLTEDEKQRNKALYFKNYNYENFISGLDSDLRKIFSETPSAYMQEN
jgi:hypothetical protein